MKKRIFSILTALALIVALIPAAAVPASAANTTHTVSSSDEFHRALAAAQDGDVIQVNGSFVVKNPQSDNDSLVIDKSVTIQGGSLTLWYAGILLGSDVTFKDITLGLASNMRPAIMANGHILTLENVQRDPTTRYIHLFCGGQTGVTQGALSDAKQGSHGQIMIKGNTNLGLANIYAGSISTDGTNNAFTKPATVTIDSSVKGQPIEHIYACGALQTPTTENDWFDYEHEIAPPTPSTDRFKVSGDATFNLYGTAVKEVDGSTGTVGKYANVTYRGTDYLNDGLILKNIGGLTLQYGNLTPAAGSTFGMANAPLGVAANATLGLQNLGNVTVGNFTGGGTLVLGQSQKLTVVGTVSGTTTVGIGGIFGGHSQAIPTLGSTYIDAASSTADSFTLAAYASQPNIKLVRSESGAWTATKDENVVIVNDFKLDSAVVTLPENSGGDGELPSLAFQDVLPADIGFPFSSIPLTISVNNVNTTMTDVDGSYRYSTDTLDLEVAVGDRGEGEVLQVSGKDYALPSAGTYVISVTVPATNSGTGQPITRTAALTVKAAGGGNTVISPPVSADGLVYNGKEQVGVPLNAAYKVTGGQYAATDAGEYTVSFTPAKGFTWTDGQTTEIERTWWIDKASNPNRPPSLSAAAPTAYNGRDGKIIGTTAVMEYANNSSFTGATPCAANETTGLAPGDYYVRIAESKNYEAGTAVLVTVPQGPVTVTSIAISSTGHKTAYNVGEKLDVSGLTLRVTMSDGKTYTVPAAAGMVSGFSSSSAVQSKTLTVTYGGKTTTYTVSITGGGSTGGGSTGGGSTGGGSTGGGSTGGGSTGGGSSSGGSTGGSSSSGGSSAKDKETAGEGKPATDPVYNDIPANAWYNDAVSFVTEKGLMSGTGMNTFAPNDNLTRAMLAQILYNNEEKPTTSGSLFTDVQSGVWYAEAISWANQKGIVRGYGNGQFGPDDNITREQLAVMLWRYAGEPTSNASLNRFTDMDKVGDYTLTALQWAVEKGIISGKGNGTLDPTGNATRAEAAQMLMKYFKSK